MSEQIAIRIPERLAEGLEELVREGGFRSKAAVVRAAVEWFVEVERRRRIGRQIADGYVRVPQSDDEIEGARAAAIRSIGEEPW